MPSHGIFPLSTSFDAAGPMGTTVGCCAILDSLMAGEDGQSVILPMNKLRLAIPIGYLFDDLDDHVARCFAAAIDALSAAGAVIEDVPIAPIEAVRPATTLKALLRRSICIASRSSKSDAVAEYDPTLHTAFLAVKIFQPLTISICLPRERKSGPMCR